MQNTDGSAHFMVISTSGDQRKQTVSDVSTGAACVLAAMFAKASPIFSQIPGMESYAADLLSRAELSWTWLYYLVSLIGSAERLPARHF